jgi:putative CocE/NonD family hydrolase
MGRVFGAALIAIVLASSMFTSMALAQPAAAFGAYRPAPQFAGSVTTSIYLPMRDGVHLALSITRPATDGRPAEGRFPVIWQHTLGIAGAGAEGGPLGADPALRGYRGAPTLARQGYVVVQVARRGQGPSFGRRRGYNDRTEAYDAYEVIDWLAAQPWSTGAVGIYGCSNTGDAAMHAVTAGNPHLKAAWAGCFSFEKYDAFLRGGIFANWGTGPERSIAEDMTNTPVQGDEAKVLLRQAAEEHQGATVLAEMWRAMPYRDSWAAGPMSRFWYEGSIASYWPQVQRSGTAVYVQGGWYDDLRAQGLTTWVNLTGDRHVVIGPWTHCANGDFDMLGEMLRFFDTHLKGVDAGLAAQDPIHYFTINAPAGQQWRASKTWPVEGATPTAFYLDPKGALAAAAPRAKTGGATFSVRYDLACPAEQRRTNALLTGANPCPQEHAGPHFVSTVLKADTEVTGDAVADLWISANTTDANVFAYLEDVAPDGAVTSVTDARLKASLRKLNRPAYRNFDLPWHRAAAADAQPLVAGEPAELTFTFLPTSYVFKAGHRIRISVQGADYRERDRKALDPAPVLTVHGSAAYPSRVLLPIVTRRG